MLNNIKIKEDILSDEKFKYLFTVDAVNQMVVAGTPFRDAYKTVGNQVADGTFRYDPDTSAITTSPHEGNIYRLCNGEIRKEMEKVMQKILSH